MAKVPILAHLAAPHNLESVTGLSQILGDPKGFRRTTSSHTFRVCLPTTLLWPLLCYRLLSILDMLNSFLPSLSSPSRPELMSTISIM